MIQFTTVTLLYSFASSLGDFQVFPQEIHFTAAEHAFKFLYIDLFIIIPIAVSSESGTISL